MVVSGCKGLYHKSEIIFLSRKRFVALENILKRAGPSLSVSKYPFSLISIRPFLCVSKIVLFKAYTASKKLLIYNSKPYYNNGTDNIKIFREIT